LRGGAKDFFPIDDAKNVLWIAGPNDFSGTYGVTTSWNACVAGDLENETDENETDANRNASMLRPRSSLVEASH
jgi:hypothetical protein